MQKTPRFIKVGKPCCHSCTIRQKHDYNDTMRSNVLTKCWYVSCHRMIFRICIQSEYFKSVVCHVGERGELMIFSLSFSPFQTQSCVWQKGWMSRQLAGDKLPFWASWLPNDLVLFPQHFPAKAGQLFSENIFLILTFVPP